MTIRPDEAMSRLYPAPAAPGPAPAPAAAAELDIAGRLVIALDAMTAAAARLEARRERARLSWEQCHLIDIPPAQSTAAGVIDPPDIWQPRAGWAWQVVLLPAVLGPAGTSMTLYRDAAIPTNQVLSSTVSGLFEPKGLFLLPGRRLVWASAGDALTVCTGQAVEIALDALPAYLM